MFTLDQARAFIAVAEELHFGRAATRLNMTQPPLSRQIQALEREVGVELLLRDSRRVELTDAGTAFLADVKRLVSESRQASARARSVAAGKAGNLRIGFTATSAWIVLGALLHAIDRSLPDVEITLAERVTRDQTAALVAGDLDIGIARPTFDRDVVDSVLLKRDRLQLAVPDCHPFALAGKPVGAEDLADVPLIDYSSFDARYFHDLVGRILPAGHRAIVHTVSQVETMVALVAAGRGVAFVPESVRRFRLDGVTFVDCPPAEEAPAELHLVWLRRMTNPIVPRVVELVRTLPGEW